MNLEIEKKIKEVDSLVYESSKIAELHKEIIVITKKKVMWQSIAITLGALWFCFFLLILVVS